MAVSDDLFEQERFLWKFGGQVGNSSELNEVILGF